MNIQISFIDNTRKAFWIRIENTLMYFSFHTMIGVEAAGQQLRRHNEWGMTTGRHINKLGIRQFKEAEEHELTDLASRQLASDGMNAFNKYFRQGIKP